MVWLVQNCRSNKCLQFLKPPELPGGFALLCPVPGLCSGPDGDLKQSPDPSPTHAPPNHKSWIRPWSSLASLVIFDWAVLQENVNVNRLTTTDWRTKDGS